jgi:hypothetical protein
MNIYIYIYMNNYRKSSNNFQFVFNLEFGVHINIPKHTSLYKHICKCTYLLIYIFERIYRFKLEYLAWCLQW